jgi:glycerophosphoryl diester phosphodiesterase
MTTFLRAAAALLMGAMTIASAQAAPPLIFGHRGAAAHRPEHTLGSYELAIDEGADFVEPDLVSTKDGVLVCRHENYIGGDSSKLTGGDTTDVASHPEFASRKTTKTIDGTVLTGWFVEDFTLAELKTLRARERLPQLRPQNQAYDGQFAVPTLQEVIDLVRRKEKQTGRRIGIIPETKHPSYFQSIGLALEEPLAKVLRANGYDSAREPVFIQSFEVANLIKLRTLTKARLVQLIDSADARPYDFVIAGDKRTYGDLLTPEGLKGIRAHADAIGPEKSSVISRDAAGNLTVPSSLVADAHAVGLLVTPYTFRPENYFLPTNLRKGDDLKAYGDDRAEFLAFFKAGVDAVFADAPDRARAALDAYTEAKKKADK